MNRPSASSTPQSTSTREHELLCPSVRICNEWKFDNPSNGVGPLIPDDMISIEIQPGYNSQLSSAPTPGKPSSSEKENFLRNGRIINELRTVTRENKVWQEKLDSTYIQSHIIRSIGMIESLYQSEIPAYGRLVCLNNGLASEFRPVVSSGGAKRWGMDIYETHLVEPKDKVFTFEDNSDKATNIQINLNTTQDSAPPNLRRDSIGSITLEYGMPESYKTSNGQGPGSLINELIKTTLNHKWWSPRITEAAIMKNLGMEYHPNRNYMYDRMEYTTDQVDVKITKTADRNREETGSKYQMTIRPRHSESSGAQLLNHLRSSDG